MIEAQRKNKGSEEKRERIGGNGAKPTKDIYIANKRVSRVATNQRERKREIIICIETHRCLSVRVRE